LNAVHRCSHFNRVITSLQVQLNDFFDDELLVDDFPQQSFSKLSALTDLTLSFKKTLNTTMKMKRWKEKRKIYWLR